MPGNALSIAMSRPGCCGDWVCCVGLFVTVLYYPFFWINYAMTVTLHNIVVHKARGQGGATMSSPAPRFRTRHGTA
jgi:hypothetical protein